MNSRMLFLLMKQPRSVTVISTCILLIILHQQSKRPHLQFNYFILAFRYLFALVRARLLQKAKLEACQRAFLEQAPQIAQSIHGQDLEAAKLATRSLRDIVSVLAVYRTPEVINQCQYHRRLCSQIAPSLCLLFSHR